MSNDKKCIFHVPNPIYEDGKSGSSVRPFKMMNAFKNIGYDVEVISGYGSERMHSIKSIEKKIKNGVKYDFLYSESNTIPTALTEKNHIPKYFNLDFRFFKFCKKNNIPIGLFYRDIYWKFPIFKETIKGYKRYILKPLFKYDLVQYRKYLNCMFLPTMLMSKYIDKKYWPPIVTDLPPGAEYRNEKKLDDTFSEKLRLLYIGGIGDLYRFDALLEAIYDLEKVKLTICCRKDEWNENRQIYEPFLTKNIQIVHKSGEELVELYDNADICVALFKTTEYRKLAMPVKIFEYLSFQKPIIATNDTSAGQFVRDNNIGWSINYSVDNIKSTIVDILNNRDQLDIIKTNIYQKLLNNTWEKRAEKVVDVLHNARK